ncbi:uncharacterized protein METZ01_LOCUS491755, partial [marine metagenome]
MSRVLLRLLISAGFSFALLAGLIHFLVARGDDINLVTIYQVLSGVPVALVVVYGLLQLIGFSLRALRYRIILDESDDFDVPPFRHLYFVTGIRSMMVDLLPARLGELVFVLLLNRGYQVPVAASLSAL